MKVLIKVLPWFLVALFASEIIAVLAPKKDGEFHVREFGKLPALQNGRIQPLDSVGLNSLRELRGTGDVPLEEVPSWQFWHHAKKLKSTEWLLEVMCRPEKADQRPIFLIHHPELLGELGLENKGVEKSGLRYYTYNQLKPVRDTVTNQATQIQKRDEEGKTWSTVEKQTVKVARALVTYERLKNGIRAENSDDPAADLRHFNELAQTGVAEFRKREADQPYDEKALDAFAGPLQQYFNVANFAMPLLVPPLHPTPATRDAWVNIGAGILESVRSGELSPVVDWFARMATAYRHKNAQEFNAAISEYNNWLNADYAKEKQKGRWEFFYNDSKLFLHAMIIYLMAFLLAGGSLLASSLSPNVSESLRRSAFYLMILAGLVHTSGLVFRMVLEGRPPVTNLYSSAIFIGWGAMVLGFFLERIYRLGLGTAVGSLAGFITLIIAHNLALGGDTMEMLRAVLDTNFWLATHVVVVTLGYASTFFAGLLAICYILLGLGTPVLSRVLQPASSHAASSAGSRQSVKAVSSVASADVGKALSKMVYAIICFATLFSFVGTILGGIWADQSWGRFWGWDPKENGALIIVIWNALILHARWGGIVRERGLINMAVFGNIVTSFSWFGVNMLGIGLHSYGFMDAAFKWLVLFIASQVLIILLGLIPPQYWRSFRARGSSTTPPTSPPGATPAPSAT
ncbi:MAG TPA: cytochrome c biogenesis protein CcsA [Verrucomicrobiae bacterium]|nr:cytochrome c biogenesis protein CcsA [Verrucomicrobiae bacterium]